ncbi:glycoside hydrolase family 65 protein [Bacillus sp. CGMCC 1.16607]|uniref:glycoside hydrolase family 65 protein n=1 Tax=Bacillus sp. CGMCC 1.16607 TaxID=3351842 RepID=UPI00363A088D
MTWKINSESIQEKQLLTEESLFFTGNGYLGVRGNFEEGLPEGISSIRGTYLNAFHDVVSIDYGEKLYAFPETQQKLVNLIDAQSIYLYLGEEKFSLFEGEVLSYERYLHLDRGFSERIVHWRSNAGKEVKLRFLRLASFSDKEVFIQKVIIEPVNYFGEIRIVSTVNGNVTNFVDPNDPRVSSGHAKCLKVTNQFSDENLAYVEVETLRSELKSACGVHYLVNPELHREDKQIDGLIESEFTGVLNETLVFEKRSVYVDSLRHGEKIDQIVLELNRRVANETFDSFLAKQSSYLNAFWKNADVQIKGDDKLQEGLRFNLFHLLQSAGQDKFSNIAAKGLSGEGYEGHYFWDTEIYMIPVFLMTNPEIAKRLLIYRYSILDGARERAKEMGHRKGALFPWRTISGSECSSYFPAGTAQYHISADIAYSFIQYFMVTGDLEFLKEYGAEVLFETARLWLEVGHFKRDEFRIDTVTGPDEYTCIINNNYYTNVMAKHNLKWAEKVYRLLDDETLNELKGKISLDENEVSKWLEAANKMFLPYDAELKLNPQDDSFLNKEVWDFEQTPSDHYPLLLHYHPLTLYRYQVCKQADTILAHFLLEDEQSLETMGHSFEYYEKVTTHDSSLSSCVFSIMASKLGYEDKAYQYFIETARMDLDNTHGNTKDGLHMANMGGTWMAIIFGFAGLRIKESGLTLQPIVPKQWEGYTFPLQYKGRELSVEVSRDVTTIKLLSGEELKISVYGKPYMVQPNVAVNVKKSE